MDHIYEVAECPYAPDTTSHTADYYLRPIAAWGQPDETCDHCPHYETIEEAVESAADMHMTMGPA